MAPQSSDIHVVEIPVVNDDIVPKQPSDSLCCSAADHRHPLSEIANSPGHLLLLKLLQREEDIAALRAGARESRLDSLKREAFQLYALFFAFHAVALTLLFTASTRQEKSTCGNWWLPGGLSLSTSLAIALTVQTRVCAYWCAATRLQRDRADARALARCMQELRMKGASLDLWKEPVSTIAAAAVAAGKRFKSSSVEVRWSGIRWVSRNLVTICLICFGGLAFGACKLILCS